MNHEGKREACKLHDFSRADFLANNPLSANCRVGWHCIVLPCLGRTRIESFWRIGIIMALVGHQPNNIFAGTQVVSLIEVPHTNTSLRFRGARSASFRGGRRPRARGFIPPGLCGCPGLCFLPFLEAE